MKILPRFCTMLVFSLGFGALIIPSTAEDNAEPATGRTEKKVRVGKALEKSRTQLDKFGNLIVEYTVKVPVVEKRVKVIDGKEVPVTVIKNVFETRTRLLAKGTYRIFNSSGDPIKADAFAKLLKDKRPVYIVRDKLPDAKQLKRLGKDAVIVVQERKISKAGKERRF